MDLAGAENHFSMPMTLGEHLDELRDHLIASLSALFGAIAICLLDQYFYMKIVLMPHTQAMEALNLPPKIQVLHYQESFFSHLKISVIAALIMTMPFIIYRLWLFVSAGLYAHEQKYFRLFFPFAVGFFIFGVLFGYFILIPLALRFLGSYGVSEIKIGFTLSSYISLFFILTVVSGVMFELPLIMLLLNKMHFFSSLDYLRQWRYFVLTAFVFAALLTPPDIVTQLLMAGPMVLLYLVGVIICRLAERMEYIRQFLLNTYDNLPQPPTT